MSGMGQQVDPAASAAMWPALYGMVGVVVGLVGNVLIVWLKNRGVVQGKRAELTSRVTLSDREQLDKLYNEMRAEYKATITAMQQEYKTTTDDLKRELKDTDIRLAETNKQMAVVQRENAQLSADIAVAKRDALFTVERYDRDRQEWTQDRAQLVAKIDTLTIQVAQLQKQPHRQGPERKE